MKTRTVAYATQMVSRVAVMIGARRQLSLRSAPVRDLRPGSFRRLAFRRLAYLRHR